MPDILERLMVYRAQLAGDFVPAVEADKFVNLMEVQHPGELQSWMRTKVVDFVTIQLGRMRRSERANATRSTTRKRFSVALAAGGTEAAQRTTVFDIHYSVDSQHTERRLADMNGEDHTFVARKHELRGNKELVLCQFHLVVANRVGTRTTKDLFTPASYTALHTQMVGP